MLGLYYGAYIRESFIHSCIRAFIHPWLSLHLKDPLLCSLVLDCWPTVCQPP